MGFLYLFIFLPVLLIAGTILLTLLVEFPIVYCTGVTKDKRYIVAVNALTNVCLNAVILFIALITMSSSQRVTEFRIGIWTLFAEALLIPVAEIVMYLGVSKKSVAKVVLITYLANFASFFVGLIVVGLCTGKGFHGISNFFMTIFGGLNT